jgi:HEAT repeat protein
MKRFLIGLSLTLILAAVLGLGLEREQLLAWYYAYRLAKANTVDRAAWAERLITLDQAAVPSLIRWLGKDDPAACDNCRLALLRLGKRWESDDRQMEEFIGQLGKAYGGLSVRGQQRVLDFAREFLDSPRTLNPDAGALSSGLQSCRELARAALKDSRPENRIKAIQLAQLPGVNSLEEIVTLLGDPAPEVRQAAMLAVGPAPEAMADEDLLYYLHDPDAKVRQLCEIALRGRGLRDNHLKLGKLMTDHRPEVRLEVLDYLRHDNDLEPGIWLRRLSHDSSPAVRAAAVRAAAEQPLIDLRDRLEQMVQNDPSPTVQQVAKYYLSCLKLRTSSAGKPQSTKSFTKD